MKTEKLQTVAKSRAMPKHVYCLLRVGLRRGEAVKLVQQLHRMIIAGHFRK